MFGIARRSAVGVLVVLGLALAAPSSSTALLPNGRQLAPMGTRVQLGNLPTGGAVTADGRYLWTASTGVGNNDVRIVDTVRHRVCQVLPVPGASGGIALDSAHRLAYVSGLPVSLWFPSQFGLPGARGDDVLVFSWSSSCGQARLVRVRSSTSAAARLDGSSSSPAGAGPTT